MTDRRILAVWQGRQFNLLTHLYNATTAEAIARVNAVEITEHPEGIVIAPRQEAGAHFEAPPMSGKYVPEMGMVEARRRGRREVRLLPTWPGAKVAAGELFRDTLTDGHTYFVLVTATAVVTVVTSPTASPAAVANSVAGLDVQALN